MPRTPANSSEAQRALTLVERLQRHFADSLTRVSEAAGVAEAFAAVEWLRDGGRHGGGERLGVGDNAVFNRASLNVSQVQYDDDATKSLGSATALSTIVHPAHPHAPSMHMHISWTQMRTGRGYWRVMADLNPSIPDEGFAAAFERAVSAAAGSTWARGRADGERYFWIPALKRHRGVRHFYLEAYATDDPAADEALAARVGEATIETYCDAVAAGLQRDVLPEDRAQQLAYHTVYLFQVLTLDRGTTSGLLVHDQNDVGILGSLPSHVDRERLASWRSKVPAPQDELVDALVDALPAGSPAAVTVEAKQRLANVVREHYRRHPEALELQASGSVVPPTVANHR